MLHFNKNNLSGVLNDSKKVTHHDFHTKKGGNEYHEPMLFEDMLTGPEMDYIFSDGEFYW